MPTLPSERLRQGLLTVAGEPIFPSYLFICLDRGDSAKSLASVRLTKGVSHLVSFGGEPARGWPDRIVTGTGSVGSVGAGEAVQAGRVRSSDRCAVRRH